MGANYLDMSDEDFAKVDLDKDIKAIEEGDQSSASDENVLPEGTNTDTIDEETAVETDPETQESTETSSEEKTEESSGEGDQVKTEEQTETGTQENTMDPVEFMKKVMQPFKASKRTIQIDNPEDAIKLMQLGADYTKKMQYISKGRQLLSSLEGAGLADPEKINFLIDLAKGDKGAIKKLLDDSKYDAWDMENTDEPETPYTPNNHIVDDQKLALTDTIEEIIQSSPKGKEMLNEVLTWDTASKDAIYSNPVALKIFNEHYESGLYEKIMAEVDKRRLLEKIPSNMPMMQAYIEVGKELDPSSSNRGTNTSTYLGETKSTPKVNAAPNANAKRAVANGTGNASSGNHSAVVNPLDLSDEEFLAKGEELFAKYLK